MRLTLLTYNVHLFSPLTALPAWFRGQVAVKDDAVRCRKIAKRLLGTSADIVALTELWHGAYASDLLSRVAHVYPHAYAAPGANYLRGQLLGSGLVLLSKHPITEATFVPFRDRAGDERWAQKGFICARVRVSPHLDVDVISTHLHAPCGDAPYAAERLSNVAQLVDAIDALQKRGRQRVLVVGDLNITAGSAEYQRLTDALSARGLKDVVEGAQEQPLVATIGNNNSLQWLFGGHNKTARVDYVFAPQDALVSASTQPRYLGAEELSASFKHPYTYKAQEGTGWVVHDLSDHYPLLATVDLGARSFIY